MILAILTLVFAALLVLGAVPVAAIIVLVGLFLDFFGSPISISASIGLLAWNQSQSYLLVAIPLFILLGEIMVRSRIADEMYNAISPWLNRMPGKLMQTNVATSAMFAATSGSSVATAATISSVALPEVDKHGYNERLFLGSIAAGATLGILIPPSINLIVYGALTNTSIPQLYIAGIVPGLILTVAFMLVTAVACLVRPDLDGAPVHADWWQRLRTLPRLGPPIFIFFIVVGSIYAGVATPTEAASLGVIAALLLTLLWRRFSVPMLNQALLGTMSTTAMLLLILIAANFLNFALGFLGLPTITRRIMTGLDVAPIVVIVGIICLYLVLGCFLDGLSMMVLTVPVLTPAVVDLGYNPVWFGILVVLVTELGLITPPMGMNCYVVQGVRRRGSIGDIFIGILPYTIALLAVVMIITAMPQVVLWLPSLMY